MHIALQLAGFWALAFATLALALTLQAVYFALIGNDLELLSLGKEATVAALASLIEGASVWAVVSFVPSAGRALAIPALIVAVIYKVAHLESWEKYDVLFLLLFQAVIVFSGAFLISGHIQVAILILGCFVVLLVLLGSFVKDL